jgi:hypothetical protein
MMQRHDPSGVIHVPTVVAATIGNRRTNRVLQLAAFEPRIHTRLRDSARQVRRQARPCVVRKIPDTIKGTPRAIAKGLRVRLLHHVLIAVLLAATVASAPAGQVHVAATEQACPAGTSPAPWVPVGDLYLPAGAIPYSTIALTRYRLAPGETRPAELDVPIMYVVESGELQYPSQAGVGILGGMLSCIPDDGASSFSSSSIITEDGFTSVNAGETMVAEHGLVGPLRNGGDIPLVLLEVRVITPEIDAASGLPIVDPIIAAREQNRAFEIRKQECKARAQAIANGTPVAPLPASPVYIEPPEPTPAFTTSGWASDATREPRKTPRACERS